MNDFQQQQLERARAYAQQRGGVCLSDTYIGGYHALHWKCSNLKHKEWQAPFNNTVKKQQWCAECGKESRREKLLKPNGLDKAIAHAHSKNGECLSTIYVNSKGKLHWKCADGHEWHATAAAVMLNNQWCSICAYKEQSNLWKNKDGLTQAKAFAKNRKGECLSTEYINSKSKLLWKCSQDTHEPWAATYSQIVSAGQWCPECSKKTISEKRVRKIFETFFGQDFSSAKPDWNVNPWTSRTLELDGYCKTFNVAFEYDGEHHFSIARYGNKKRKPNAFAYQKFKDEQKRKNCLRQGITLINIPFVDGSKRHSFVDFLNNVVLACERAGLTMTFTAHQLIKLEQDFYAI